MDVDYINSSTQAQMDFMTMMMQMEKLPAEFSELLPSSIDFSGGPSPPLIYSSPSPASPTMIGPSSTMSFCGTAIQDPALVSPPLYSDSPAGTPRGSMDLMGGGPSLDPRRTSMAAMREMIFRIAAMQPIHIDPESVKPPKRRNVKISKDPQSVAARHRRERISERIRILQRLVPGGTKMDTASMLDEAIHYVKFLKTQVQSLERAAANRTARASFSSPSAGSTNGNNYSCFTRSYQAPDQLFLNSTQMLR